MDYYLPINESSDSKYKQGLWDTAKGLQAVDGLKTSHYLDEVINENINNNLSYEGVIDKLHKYYGSNTSINFNPEQKEADLVAARIVQYINTHTFTVGIPGLTSIHEFLFKDVLGELEAGRIRKHNLYKKESILNGDTVTYGDATTIYVSLDMIFSREKRYPYIFPLSKDNISHLAEFTSDIWTVHPFAEGNTRTTAVYIIMYMRSKGLDVTNDMFKQHSEYFRNSLVRSVYENIKINVRPTYEFLEMFYENLFNNANNLLDNNILKLPINQEYKKEIQDKLARIGEQNITNQELMKFSNDPNTTVRTEANKKINERINGTDNSGRDYAEFVNNPERLVRNGIVNMNPENESVIDNSEDPGDDHS